MTDTNEEMPWKFLSDSAVQSSDQDRFGVHSAYAKVLYHIAKACETPFSIALYSNWGTGKTSICNLIEQLSEGDEEVRYVYLDVWKYSNEPLKRWILLETHRSLEAQEALLNYKFGGRSLQSHLEFEESWEDHDRLSVNYVAIRWLGIGVVLSLVAFVASLIFSPTTSLKGKILTAMTTFLAAGGMAAFLFEAVVKELFKSLSGLVFDRKVRHVSAQPAFSAEKFGEIFRDMIRQTTSASAVGAKGTRIIFVFDNLDRCSEAVAVETIGVVKTYLDEPGCVYIIPCDETALLKHIAKSYTSQDGDSGQKYAREFLNKFFQTTLRLPIAPEFDIEAFLDQQLVVAGMSDLPADARDVLVLGYLGQTPRQIKRVLNDLTAFRSLAVQAESQNLVEAGALTSNLSLLTKMSVISVEWPSFLALLADDPELWDDLDRKIATGENIDDVRIATGLRSFLHATKHVSSDADVRPFIYLKRADYERNQALATAVLNNLRKGESKEFLGLLAAAKSPSEREGIVRIATDQTGRWLDAQPPRDIFLKNSVSVLLKAAGTVAGSRSLELTVSNLLEYVMRPSKAADLAEIISLPDLFAFSPTLNTGQKEKCLEEIASLFKPSSPLGKNHLQYWVQFLDHERQLSPELRQNFRGFLEARYVVSESDTLQLLFEASKRKATVQGAEMQWVVSSSLLTTVASKLTFIEDETDRQRTSVLVTFQSQMDEEAKNAIAGSILRALQGTRTRSFDPQAQAAIGLMNELLPESLGQSQLDAIAAVLIEQVTAQGNYVLKAPWLSPLIVIRGALPAPVQASIDNLYRPYLQDPADPAALTQLLAAITPSVCARLLAIQENVLAMHAQTTFLENRLGVNNAPPARERILNCFPASSVIDGLGIFDEGRSWDLAFFPNAVSRGRREQVVEDNLRKQIVAFIDRFLKGRSASFGGVLDLLLATAKEGPELLDEAVAGALSESCIEILGSNVEKYFAEVRFLSTKLSKQNRLSVEKELASRFVEPREAQWVQVLLKISEDLGADEDLAADKSLVYNLMDHAFEAARVSPSEASGILVSLFPHLEPDRARGYVDEAQDRLIALESSGEPISQMEPYLRMLKNAGSALGETLPEKLATFCDRMVGPAKPEDEREVALSFLRDTRLPFTNFALAERILELVPEEDALADASRKVIAQSHAS